MSRIICIDDDRDILASLKMILESNGHEVMTAESGDMGFKEAQKWNPDVIILDVMMDDDTDGFHTAYRFRQSEQLKFKPILMLTSVNQVSNFNFSKENSGEFLPVDEFIEKPISPEKLTALIDKLVRLTKEQINVDGRAS